MTSIQDQPAPIPNDSESIWDLVIEEMRNRDQVGRSRYGTPLQIGNGRDHLRDAFQEALDLVVYLRAAIEERDRDYPLEGHQADREALREYLDAHRLVDPKVDRNYFGTALRVIRENSFRRTNRPKVICFCGSTRFTAEMLIIKWQREKEGIIVLSWNALPDSYFKGARTNAAEQEGVKDRIDELHKRKIDLADEVFVINIGGYIGESTRSEIDYAIIHGKSVRYLEESLDCYRDAEEALQELHGAV